MIVFFQSIFAFLLVLVPSRMTSIEGASEESAFYDILLEMLDGQDVHTLDLRDVFGIHEDSASLYYSIDTHWNAKGMRLAAEAILGVMEG